ncbi:MAG: hypothetical protein EGP63_09935, partial [Bacteroides stercoris]|nr:hypothetical protein [Bacteroides stercoris]
KAIVADRKEKERDKRLEAMLPAHIRRESVGDDDIPQLNLIIKANTHGSAEAVAQAIAQVESKEITTKIIHVGVGDISEVKAIQEVFGKHAYELNISSTKSMTGHLLGAAGAVEAIASILAIKNGIIPPTINHEEGDNDENIDYDLNFTFNKAQKREVNVALSNTFGFGGHNACVIFKKYAE